MPKILYIEARKKLKLNKELVKELAGGLPNTIYLAYSIQYKKLAEELKKELAKSRTIKIHGSSQVLGCSKLKTSTPILLIGSGRFHALNLALSSQKEVFIFDNYSISKIGKEEIEQEQRKEKGNYLKFLASKEIGILVSTKSGQQNLSLALKLKDKLKKQGKNPFLFLSDNINIQELENFPIDLWINTACPGISLDSPRIIDSRNLEKL